MKSLLLLLIVAFPAFAQDTDLDGLLDSTEIQIGTDPGLVDTDGDGVDDKSEVDLGYLNTPGWDYPLNSPAYVGWNTFLGASNVVEIENRSNSNQGIIVVMLDALGEEIIRTPVGIGPGQKRDIVLDIFLPDNAYGMARLEFNSHAIKARSALYYGPKLSYAYHDEAREPLTGESFVMYNTYDPSASQAYQVESWLSLRNVSSSSEFFIITKYDPLGEIAQTIGITVPAEGRIDVFGGLPQVGAGYIKVDTFNDGVPYLASIIRKGRTADGVYQYAALTEARPAVSADYVSLYGATSINVVTNYLEIANVCDSTESIILTGKNKNGDTMFANYYSFEPNTNNHLQYFVGSSLFVSLSGTAECFVLSSFTYKTFDQRRLSFEKFDLVPEITGLATRGGNTPLTGTLIARYNNFLGQTPVIKIVNVSSSSQSVRILLRDASGAESERSVDISPGATFIDTIGFADTYGTVEVTGTQILAEVVTTGGFQYEFMDFYKAR